MAAPSTSFVQFDYCNLCKISHRKRKKHIYSTRHQEILKNLLKKFKKKIDDAVATIDDPEIEGLGFEAGARFWCYFCQSDVDKHSTETDCTVKHSGLLHHITSDEHAKKTGEFFWQNIVDRNKKTNFVLNKNRLERFRNKSDTAATVYRKKVASRIQQIAAKIKKHEDQQERLVKLSRSQISTKQTQISHLAPVSSVASDASGRKTVQATAAGLTAVSISQDNEGNIFTGATPPWLRKDEDDAGGGGEIGPSVKEYNKHVEREKKKKLPPNRVGANFDSSATTSTTWLPSFGGVWHHGRRQNAKIQFERRGGFKDKKMLPATVSRSAELISVVPYKRKLKPLPETVTSDVCSISTSVLESQGADVGMQLIAAPVLESEQTGRVIQRIPFPLTGSIHPNSQYKSAVAKQSSSTVKEFGTVASTFGLLPPPELMQNQMKLVPSSFVSCANIMRNSPQDLEAIANLSALANTEMCASDQGSLVVNSFNEIAGSSNSKSNDSGTNMSETGNKVDLGSANVVPEASSSIIETINQAYDESKKVQDISKSKNNLRKVELEMTPRVVSKSRNATCKSFRNREQSASQKVTLLAGDTSVLKRTALSDKNEETQVKRQKVGHESLASTKGRKNSMVDSEQQSPPVEHPLPASPPLPETPPYQPPLPASPRLPETPLHEPPLPASPPLPETPLHQPPLPGTPLHQPPLPGTPPYQPPLPKPSPFKPPFPAKPPYEPLLTSPQNESPVPTRSQLGPPPSARPQFCRSSSNTYPEQQPGVPTFCMPRLGQPYRNFRPSHFVNPYTRNPYPRHQFPPPYPPQFLQHPLQNFSSQTTQHSVVHQMGNYQFVPGSDLSCQETYNPRFHQRQPEVLNQSHFMQPTLHVQNLPGAPSNSGELSITKTNTSESQGLNLFQSISAAVSSKLPF